MPPMSSVRVTPCAAPWPRCPGRPRVRRWVGAPEQASRSPPCTRQAAAGGLRGPEAAVLGQASGSPRGPIGRRPRKSEGPVGAPNGPGTSLLPGNRCPGRPLAVPWRIGRRTGGRGRARTKPLWADSIPLSNAESIGPRLTMSLRHPGQNQKMTPSAGDVCSTVLDEWNQQSSDVEVASDGDGGSARFTHTLYAPVPVPVLAVLTPPELPRFSDVRAAPLPINVPSIFDGIASIFGGTFLASCPGTVLPAQNPTRSVTSGNLKRRQRGQAAR